MGKRVLLISTNTCAAPDPVFPLGLAHLSAALREAGHESRWYDFQAPDSSLEQVLTEYRPDLVGISLRNIDDVLIRTKETYFDGLPALCERIRKAAAVPIVLGGSGFSIFPEELFRFSGADFGVAGAGEVPLVALLQGLEEPGLVGKIPGLLYRRNGATLRNLPSCEVIHPRLNTIDRPSALVQHYLGAGGMLNLQTQRGCAFHCCYCTYPLLEGRAHRRHHPDQVAEEFHQLQQLGARYAFIVDSVFNSSPRHVTEICEALLRRNLKIKWGCFLRPQGLSASLLQLMSRAGLSHIEFGSDSFSDEVLVAYQKGFTFEDILRSSALASEQRLDYCHFLIAGGPGETLETLREGFDRSKRLQGAVIMAVIGTRIYPGTAVHQRAVREGVIASETSLLNPVYYVSSALTPDLIHQELTGFAKVCPNWIVGDPNPAYASLAERLRKRGVIGPLWSYLSMLQRVWPAMSAQVHTP
jgi:radical SAM superfamily enzyme YgiQ (UPF0313 family)